MFYTMAGTNLSRDKFNAEPIFTNGGFAWNLKYIREYLQYSAEDLTSYFFKTPEKNTFPGECYFSAKSKSGNF